MRTSLDNDIAGVIPHLKGLAAAQPRSVVGYVSNIKGAYSEWLAEQLQWATDRKSFAGGTQSARRGMIWSCGVGHSCGSVSPRLPGLDLRSPYSRGPPASRHRLPG